MCEIELNYDMGHQSEKELDGIAQKSPGGKINDQ